MFRFGFSDWIQAGHGSNAGRKCALDTGHDSSFGLTAARSHCQKQSDEQWLELHVDHLCMHRVSSVNNKKEEEKACTVRLVCARARVS